MTTTQEPLNMTDTSESETLELVRDNALRLLSGFSRPPSALRIRVGVVTVEAEWADTPAGEPAAGLLGEPPATTLPSNETAGRPLAAPTVGVFYRAPQPGAAPFADVGQRVTAGQQVAIIEAMKLMIPVKAEFTGTIAEVLHDDGDAVEYGESLFLVLPE